jgi:inhibitor of cysteine peptidase
MREIVLSANDKGKIQNVSVGDSVVIRLPENPTTGYRWVFKEVDHKGILTTDPSKIEFVAHPESGIGGGGTRTFRFAAKSHGTVVIKLVLKRSWEPEGSAIDKFETTVSVH